MKFIIFFRVGNFIFGDVSQLKSAVYRTIIREAWIVALKYQKPRLKLGRRRGVALVRAKEKGKSETKKVLITLPKKLVEKLDNYAEHNTMGKRSIAVWYILKQFLEKEPEPETPP